MILSDRLASESISWSKSHFERFGDTDILPVPFEYEAVSKAWTSMSVLLASIDLASYSTRAARRFLLPKQKGGFRVVTQLDPLDAFVYAAAVYEAAPFVEKARTAKSARIACSYRVMVAPEGALFGVETGWSDFTERSAELSASGEFVFVVTADISDFYNQISHHRVQNALADAGVTSARASNIERFLTNLTGGTSRGIPVGPSASNVLAEVCLDDVDKHLLGRGFVHTRFVDDFRIFCQSRLQAQRALHDLSEYLYTSHRLALQSSKTAIVSVAEFSEVNLQDPERLQEQSKIERINGLLGGWSPYTSSVEEDDLPDVDEPAIVRECLRELFAECIATDNLRLGMVRYALRRGRQLRTNVLRESVLCNLSVLVPVMRDAMLYLFAATRTADREELAERLAGFLETSEFGFLPIAHLWVGQILRQCGPEGEELARQACEAARIHEFGCRERALLASQQGHVEWMRQHKEIWQNHSPWERRAMIWASSAMTTDERNPWLSRVASACDPLEAIIVSAARQAG